MRSKLSEEELRWQRRSDARTLAEAETIRADKERFNQAKLGAKEILEEESKRLRGLNKVVGKSTSKKTDKGYSSMEKPRKPSVNLKGLPHDIPDVFKR